MDQTKVILQFFLRIENLFTNFTCVISVILNIELPHYFDKFPYQLFKLNLLKSEKQLNLFDLFLQWKHYHVHIIFVFWSNYSKKVWKSEFFLKDYFLSARWVFLSLHLFIDFEICTYPFKGFSDISYFSDRSETDSLFILFLQNFFAEYLTFSIMANFFFYFQRF